MILNYSTKFKDGTPTNFERKVKDGIKKTSIRKDPHNRWKQGMKIQHSTGARTKKYNCFAEAVASSVQRIVIDHFFPKPEGYYFVYKTTLFGHYHEIVYNIRVDDKILSVEEIHQLAKDDGFESTDAFFEWFNGDFDGKLIGWTDLVIINEFK